MLKEVVVEIEVRFKQGRRVVRLRVESTGVAQLSGPQFNGAGSEDLERLASVFGNWVKMRGLRKAMEEYGRGHHRLSPEDLSDA